MWQERDGGWHVASKCCIRAWLLLSHSQSYTRGLTFLQRGWEPGWGEHATHQAVCVPTKALSALTSTPCPFILRPRDVPDLNYHLALLVIKEVYVQCLLALSVPAVGSRAA